jgi:hypothetical protein
MRIVKNITAAAQTPVPLTAAPSATSASSQIIARKTAQLNSVDNHFPVSQIGAANPFYAQISNPPVKL